MEIEEIIPCNFCESQFPPEELINHSQNCTHRPKTLKNDEAQYSKFDIEQIKLDIEKGYSKYGPQSLNILLKYLSNALKDPKHRKIRIKNDFFQKHIYTNEDLLKLFLRLNWTLDLKGEYYEFISDQKESFELLEITTNELKKLNIDKNKNQKENKNDLNKNNNNNEKKFIEISNDPIFIELSDDEEETKEEDQFDLIKKKRKEEFLSKRPNANVKEQKHTGNFRVNSELKDQLRKIRLEKRKNFLSTEGKKVTTLSDLSEKEKERQKSLSEFGNRTMTPEMIQIGKEVLHLTNEFRKQHNKPPLKWHQSISEIGQEHSKNMSFKKVPFGHQGFNDRVKKFPFISSSAAENVAWCTHPLFECAKIAVDGWIHSEGHRKNLLSAHEFCGVGVYRNESGETYFTQLFANIS